MAVLEQIFIIFDDSSLLHLKDQFEPLHNTFKQSTPKLLWDN